MNLREFAIEQDTSAKTNNIKSGVRIYLEKRELKEIFYLMHLLFKKIC